MKKIFFWVILLLCSSLSHAQTAKRPTIMVLPSDHWCTSRYFTTTLKNQGKTVILNDYGTAFREDAELSAVVSKIGQLMVDREYPVKDYVQESRSIQDRTAENEATMSTGGSGIMETPLDILRRHVKYDIELRIDWTVNKESKGESVSFTLEAVDTYTSKRVAVSTGTGMASDEIVPRLLEIAVEEHMNEFSSQLINYFDNLQTKGREISLFVQTWDSGNINLEDEFDGEMLLDIIQDWLDKNTVAGAYNLTDNTETKAQFEQVRIPFFNEKGRAMDARAFGVQMKKFLSQPPYSIDSKVLTRGLGEVIIIIGEK